MNIKQRVFVTSFQTGTIGTGTRNQLTLPLGGGLDEGVVVVLVVVEHAIVVFAQFSDAIANEGGFQVDTEVGVGEH